MRPDPAWDELPIRPELVDARPYGAPQLDLPVCLNVNENPFPPPPQVLHDMMSAVEYALRTINRYPDREAVLLREKLARYVGHGLTMENMWAANGSNEVMTQVLQAFGGPGRTMMTFTPTYSMYPEYARDTHTEFVTSPRTPTFEIDPDQAMAAITTHRPSVVIVASPNNPTGTVTGLGLIEQILDACDGIVVVDEAYQEFSSQDSALTLLPHHGNLIVARTMSKAFAFAGGRLGYACAAPSVIDALRVVRLPYHLNAVTQAVAGAALDHAAEMLAHVDQLCLTRDEAMARLRAMGLTVVDSAANFFLFGPFADRHSVWSGLVDRGVLVRETGPRPFLRVCVGTEAEMDRFYQGLGEVLTDPITHIERRTS